MNSYFKIFITLFLFLHLSGFSLPYEKKTGVEWLQSIKETPTFVYSDFGGKNRKGNEPISDIQTANELASAAWNRTQTPYLLINDSAKPLSPLDAAHNLAVTFPYTKSSTLEKIKAVVVHVIDPGVENEKTAKGHHPRSVVQRKDGIVFIGPDNGTLSFVCPKESIQAIWEIDIEKLSKFLEIDLAAGGTFHGRDIFLELATLIARQYAQPGDFCHKYDDLKNRIQYREIEQKLTPLSFEYYPTNVLRLDWEETDDPSENFNKAYLLNIIQSPYPAFSHKISRQVRQDAAPDSFTNIREHCPGDKARIFGDEDGVTDCLNCQRCCENVGFYSKTNKIYSVGSHPEVIIVNKKTGNIYVGPNNGWGTSFFSGFDEKDIYTIPSIKLKEIPFLGTLEDAIYNESGEPIGIRAKIWIDNYGNIKTTLSSDVFTKIFGTKNNRFKVELNGYNKEAIKKKSFARTPKNQLILYSGSTAAKGPNPNRSNRYIECSTNGIWGTFGIDQFSNKNRKPFYGQTITIWKSHS